MKKFNPEEELQKIQSRNVSINTNSKVKGTFIPALILACFGVSILGASISNSLTVEENEFYTVNIDIINGPQTKYIKKVSKGEFSAEILSDATYGSLTCTKGTLSYDAETGKVYSSNINEDTDCILAFMDNGTKAIQMSQLKSINDNTGKSYYFRGDSKNNYIKINNIMFRIVRINGDGSYRLITNENIQESSYGERNLYDSSAIKEVVTNWINYANIPNLVEADYDFNNYQYLELENLINFNTYRIDNVGLLTAKEAYLVSDGLDSSYLDGTYYLSNAYGAFNAWAIKDGVITNTDSNEVLGVRPVINIKIDTLKGQGTEELPYEIG